MTLLGVNIDHCATLRQARYKETSRESGIIIEPDILQSASAAEMGGADSITAHLREDRRHMIDSDLFELRKSIKTKLNMELACTPNMIETALKLRPDFVCLVPENRAEVTTEGGLNAAAKIDELAEVAKKFAEANILCSLFIDPDTAQVDAAKKIGAPIIELHTGAYANAWGNPEKKREQTKRISEACTLAKELGLTVNAGHGINYANIGELLEICRFNELNIGHSIVSRAIFTGLENAVREMKNLIEKFS